MLVVFSAFVECQPHVCCGDRRTARKVPPRRRQRGDGQRKQEEHTSDAELGRIPGELALRALLTLAGSRRDVSRKLLRHDPAQRMID
jgi:hypothetical protein